MKLMRLLFLLLCMSTPAHGERAEKWTPVKDNSLILKENSPLDFSGLVSNEMAGSKGRVVINKDGDFAFESRTDEPVRFLAASINWSDIHGGYPSKALADTYARQLKLHGYNLARFVNVETYIMTDRKGDFDYDPDRLDRFFYFLSALKKQGIYWLVTGLTSKNGAYGDVEPHRWVDKHDLKLDMYYDADKRAHWGKLFDSLWNKKNPYTGKSALADSALFGIVLVNENGLNYLLRTRKHYPEKVRVDFNNWLIKKYGTTANLRKGWNYLLNPFESLEAKSISLPSAVNEKSFKNRDFQEYIVQKETELSSWQINHLRKMGYQGLLTGLDNWFSLTASKSRSVFNWIDMHNYHDEVTSYAKGTRNKQVSSFENGFKYLRQFAASSEFSKPFSITEYGQPFWNKYRHESGVVVPAYASMQGWNLLCQHAEGPIDFSYNARGKRKQQLVPYNIGLDPVLRGGETLAALLFLRGDVAESKGGVVVNLTGDQWQSTLGQGFLSDSLSKISLLTKFNLSFDSLQKGKKNLFEVKKYAGEGQVAKMLKASGNLSNANRTHFSNGIYESDTNELYVDFDQQEFIVSTPFTKAAILRQGRSSSVGGFLVKEPSADGMIAFSSIDDTSIDQSKKILLIVTTDARNSNMVLSDNEKEIVDIGTFPVLLKNIKAEVEFRSNSQWTLSRLNLRGEEVERHQVGLEGDKNSFLLKNYSTEYGATTYFLLTRK